MEKGKGNYLYMHHMYNYNTCHLASEKTRQVNMIKAVYWTNKVDIAQLQAGNIQYIGSR